MSYLQFARSWKGDKIQYKNGKLFFAHQTKEKTCAIGNHFLDNHLGVWEESYELNETFDIKGIAMLTNVPSNPKQKTRIN